MLRANEVREDWYPYPHVIDEMVKGEKSIGLITTVVECDSQIPKMVPITFTPHATPVITYLTWQKGFCICN